LTTAAQSPGWERRLSWRQLSASAATSIVRIAGATRDGVMRRAPRFGGRFARPPRFC